MFTRPTSRLLLGMAVLGAASFGLAASPALALSFPCTTGVDCLEDTINGFAYDPVGDNIISMFVLPVDTADLTFVENSGVYSFTVDYGAQMSNINDTTEYQIAIDLANAPSQAFQTVSLSYNAVGSVVEKYIYESVSDFDETNMTANLLAKLTTTNPTYNVTPGLQSLFIVDMITDNGGTISSFTNSFTQYTGVPGPLPLMGAGAAFGFSRRLRRRTRQAYNLG